MKSLMEVMKVAKGDLPIIYCDMDEVLCAFMKGAKDAIGADFVSSDKQKRWSIISNTKNFWANLDWMPGAKRLYDFIIRYESRILSAYSNRDGNSKIGKMKWLKKNTKFKNADIHLVMRSQKQVYAMTQGKPNVLIDDKPTNIKKWSDAGGIGLQFQANKDSVDVLKRRINEVIT